MDPKSQFCSDKNLSINLSDDSPFTQCTLGTGVLRLIYNLSKVNEQGNYHYYIQQNQYN